MLSLAATLAVALTAYAGSRVFALDSLAWTRKLKDWLNQPYVAEPIVGPTNEKGEYTIIDAPPEKITLRKRAGRKLSKMLSCLFCLTFWAGVIILIWCDVFDLLPLHAALWPIAAFQVRGATLIIGRIEWVDQILTNMNQIQRLTLGYNATNKTEHDHVD